MSWLLVLACVGIAAGSAVGFVAAERERGDTSGHAGWRASVRKVVRSGPGDGGFSVGGAPLAEGASVGAGARLVTDDKTQAQLSFQDGSTMVLDRGTIAHVDDGPRRVRLEQGRVLLDVASAENGTEEPAKLDLPQGSLNIGAGKVVATVASGRSNVGVVRGEAVVTPRRGLARSVLAGQEGVLGDDGTIDVAPVGDLAERTSFGGEFARPEGLTDADTDRAIPGGLGELRAKRPGQSDEKDHAVLLTRHDVRVRIAGAVARTEIDETFTNDTGDELEGIYRFPLPNGAQIERLALDVDGTLVDGEFVDKAKGAAIWRGAIQNAAPRAPKPVDEIIWVPGRWHDPALLEWARGGRFELRVFPIPRHGSRRVVIAYTQAIGETAGTRRYVYPLPSGSSSKLTIGSFSLDAQIVGNDAAAPVTALGYELEQRKEGAITRLSATRSAFVPSGDLALTYAVPDKGAEILAWGHQGEESTTNEPDVRHRAILPGERFATIALRPRLPGWTEARPRDHVVVVDAGRSMHGERFTRARRLAVQMTEEMDRRDRVTVLACDVTCVALPGGFLAPGGPAAHDVDAFLGAVKPDGASDLVGAVRRASSLEGRDGKRELRVTLVSDGVASAGYRTAAHVARGVRRAFASEASQLVTVPVGSDADEDLLDAMAKAGGGVLVPYGPSRTADAVALDVLAATYGKVLRDVELTLPAGLEQVAPAQLGSLRAGAETMVHARMSRPEVRGDVVLRGTIGGERFERSWPVTIEARRDAGNAFVPRLYAAARIHDREGEAVDDAGRRELVALSQRYRVPSKFTSLLVLESEAMFTAFGIQRGDHAVRWTGESAAQGTASAPTSSSKDEGASDLMDAHEDAEGDAANKREQRSAAGPGKGFGLGGGGRASLDAEMPAEAPLARKAAPMPMATTAPIMPAPPRDRWGGRYMRRVWVGHAAIRAEAGPALADKIAAARSALDAAPDERNKHKNLVKLLAQAGRLDDLAAALDVWSGRDPLDADGVAARADLAARRGDRDGSLRILGGALASSALSARDGAIWAESVARGYERLGRPEVCAFRVAAAELAPANVDAVARAVACEASRGIGLDGWTEGMPEARVRQVVAALAKVDPARPDGSGGELTVSATWDGDVDLDVGVVDPSGRRAGVASRVRSARVVGATAHDRETLSLAAAEAGSYVVEIARTSPESAGRPVSGRLTIRAFGQSRTVPFTLSGTRAEAARVDVRWESELVPVDPPARAPGPPDVEDVPSRRRLGW